MPITIYAPASSTQHKHIISVATSRLENYGTQEITMITTLSQNYNIKMQATFVSSTQCSLQNHVQTTNIAAENQAHFNSKHITTTKKETNTNIAIIQNFVGITYIVDSSSKLIQILSQEIDQIHKIHTIVYNLHNPHNLHYVHIKT
jgi:muramoyltetrapeptide carboxypeptidase LdcA involved in peptidoglycan recycling